MIQKNASLLGQTHNLQIFGLIPFVKLQNDTWTCKLNSEK